MKKIQTLLVFLCCCSLLWAQPQKVKGQVTATDTADLSILNIYPATFPDVSVVFRAETRKGEPVWNLTKEKMRVTENGSRCDVILLEHLSTNKPIILGVVVDHSGSMGNYSVTESYTIASNGSVIDTTKSVIQPGNSPIDSAKKAVKNFVRSFNATKDKIGVIGFSDSVDIIIPPTQDINKINSTVDSMRATEGTALFDAMLKGMMEIRNTEGLKVLVVLTDGMDNASKSRWKDVIDRANLENIPVYIIGLGNVQKDTLQLIASQTKGKCYFTGSSSSLDSIYGEISKQIRAFYDLTYRSVNFSTADTSRQVELRFDIDSLYLVTGPSSTVIPAEVIAAVAQKPTSQDNYLWGGIAIVAALVIGVLIYKFFKNTADKKSDRIPVIKRVFPNPSKGPVTIEIQGHASQLKVFNMNGQPLGSFAIQGGDVHFDFSSMPRGNYIVTAYYGATPSNSMQIMLE